MRFKYIAAFSTVAVLAACGPGGSDKGGHGPGAANGMPPPEVNVVTVERQSLPVSFEYVGQTAGSREVEVRARVTGILLSRNFEEGGRVKRGQSLFTIDPAPIQAALARAEADLNLEYTRVESPVSGVASRALRSEGSLVSGPEVLLTTVMQVDPIWVNFGIPDTEQARLQKEAQAGQLSLPKHFEVELRHADGSLYPLKGKVGFSDVRISPATGTREARAVIPNPEGVLRPGQFVRVVLRGATRPNAVTVPQRAVLEGPKGKFVYVVDEKGTAQPRPVEAGEWSGDDWVISSGLKGGERVIVDGVMKLGPGAPVKAVEKK